jgi:hypothetical protein
VEDVEVLVIDHPRTCVVFTEGLNPTTAEAEVVAKESLATSLLIFGDANNPKDYLLA